MDRLFLQGGDLILVFAGDHDAEPAFILLVGGGGSDLDFTVPVRADMRRTAIAWAIWTRTSGVSQDWIAKRVNLRSAPNVSQQIRRFSKIPTGSLPGDYRKKFENGGNLSRIFDPFT